MPPAYKDRCVWGTSKFHYTLYPAFLSNAPTCSLLLMRTFHATVRTGCKRKSIWELDC